MTHFPQSVDQLEEHLSEPSEPLIEHVAALRGDLLLLGVGGKMGPTMARMARRALDAANVSARVIGVSRFTDSSVRDQLEAFGVETHVADLLDEACYDRLPDADHVIAMTGFKFGTRQDPQTTWAVNTYLPALICRRYSQSQIVAFSTGNVYGPVAAPGMGSRVGDPLIPDGEYAAAAIGRERIYEYFGRKLQIPMTLLRLNYATELRYGVLVDLALMVARQEPINLTMGWVNVIWLRDANEMTLRALTQCGTPPEILNLAGEPFVEVRYLAEELGRRLGKVPRFKGTHSGKALLNDGTEAYSKLGKPQCGLDRMLDWTAEWVQLGKPLLHRPTHFLTSDGKF